MQELDLYQPSLTKGWKRQKSYDIKNFIIVAIFGGAIPLMILGSINARWLGVFRKVAPILIPIALSLEIAKLTLYTLHYHGFIAISSGTVNISYRIACVLLYIIYMFLMKESFQYFRRTGGETKALFLPGLTLIILVIVFETLLLANFLW